MISWEVSAIIFMLFLLCLYSCSIDKHVKSIDNTILQLSDHGAMK